MKVAQAPEIAFPATPLCVIPPLTARVEALTTAALTPVLV
jgi:hypothetical protein